MADNTIIDEKAFIESSEDFLEDLNEYLVLINNAALSLERGQQLPSVVQNIKMPVQDILASSESLGYLNITHFASHLETLVTDIEKGVAIDSEFLADMFESIDKIEELKTQYLNALQAGELITFFQMQTTKVQKPVAPKIIEEKTKAPVLKKLPKEDLKKIADSLYSLKEALLRLREDGFDIKILKNAFFSLHKMEEQAKKTKALEAKEIINRTLKLLANLIHHPNDLSKEAVSYILIQLKSIENFLKKQGVFILNPPPKLLKSSPNKSISSSKNLTEVQKEVLKDTSLKLREIEKNLDYLETQGFDIALLKNSYLIIRQLKHVFDENGLDKAKDLAADLEEKLITIIIKPFNFKVKQLVPVLSLVHELQDYSGSDAPKKLVHSKADLPLFEGGQKLNIVLIESSKTFRRFLKKKLTALGHKVKTLSNPLEAMKFIFTSKPDLLITSMQFTSLSGLGLIKMLNAGSFDQEYKTKTILVTSEDIHDKSPDLIIKKEKNFMSEVISSIA